MLVVDGHGSGLDGWARCVRYALTRTSTLGLVNSSPTCASDVAGYGKISSGL